MGTRKNVFQSKMKLCFDTNRSLAAYLNVSLSRINNKINCWRGAEFTQSEIAKLKEKWDLTNDEVCDIFFTNS